MPERTAARPTRLVVAVVIGMLAIGVATTARAVELTPFGGWRFGGGFQDLETGATSDLDGAPSFGLILGIPWKAQDRSYLELVWSRQNSSVSVAEGSELDLDVDYLHLGGIALFATPHAKLDALLSGGLGATFLWPDLDGAGSEVRFSLSLGAGLLYHASDRVAIRLEARGWYTFTETGGAVFCAGGCQIAFSGSGFGQGELIAGLQLSF